MEERTTQRACLSGKDIADMLEGKVVTAFGVEFVYDGLDVGKIRDAAESLGRKSDPYPKAARSSR
jgi:hypothetical protein